jgi:hypothetical protein
VFGIARYPEYISKVVNVPISGREGTKSSKGAEAATATIAETIRDLENIFNY